MRVAIAGAGISGLHLAHALAQKEMTVTVFDPAPVGGVRIPLVHACHTIKKRAPLWEKAAEFSRTWYQSEAVHDDVVERQSEFGAYFNVRLRAYLRRMRDRLIAQGVVFKRTEIQTGDDAAADIICWAGGAATRQIAATRIIPGHESYFSRFGNPSNGANLGSHGNKITNYIHMEPRAGFIHRNDLTASAAAAFAREIHPTGRHALFYGERLTSRDRFPVVGFHDGVFFFCAMGYHGMTYAPYLAHAAAAMLAAESFTDENLISTLSPARFLSRSR